ncbi:MAG: CaiB/BaiF CoA-transferase family protein [Dehalococcoidia bacterium]|nr:CaiB/BaiF CoA-transferase family protein [Dehalococcoidia bacterium]
MQALEGILVLDLTRRYPGAYTAMFLGDFGAEVIKVDPPGAFFPHPDIDSQNERLAPTYAPDRNKKSIVINLKTDRGREVFLRLVKKADVLIEGFRPGVMDRLGAGYDALKELNPRLIYCALAGFGQDGPYADMPGHDMTYIALGGALSMVGARDGPPYLPSNYLADMAGAGLHGVIGILLALAARDKMGQGQFIDISYLDTVISLLAVEASFYMATGKVPRRGETFVSGGSPWAQALKCKDGEYFAIGCAEPHFWEHLCQAIGRKDLAPLHNPPQEKRDWVVAELQKVFLTRTRDEWWDYLKDKNTCVGPVYYLDEAFEDPQVRHRRMVLEFDHPTAGRLKQTGIPIKLSETPGEVRSLGVQTGSSRDEILSWLDYSAEDIQGLRQGGAFE